VKLNVGGLGEAKRKCPQQMIAMSELFQERYHVLIKCMVKINYFNYFYKRNPI
jgi:hypothetical protein